LHSSDSLLDLFEQPANRVFQQPARLESFWITLELLKRL
jgi:hypothetical protein